MDQHEIQQVLTAVGSAHATNKSNRPTILLTWAQSMDGKLSTAATSQTFISGPSCMQMTHALRAVHDTILVGSKTALVDDPRLTARMSPATETTLKAMVPRVPITLNSFGNPIPVVLDSRARISPDARCLQQKDFNPNASKAMLFCASDTQARPTLTEQADVIPVPRNDSPPHTLHLPSVIAHLQYRNIQSVMVEGGPTVLSSFLEAGLWDVVVVTIAPSVYGAGPALEAPMSNGGAFQSLRFCRPQWFTFGEDNVLVGLPK